MQGYIVIATDEPVTEFARRVAAGELDPAGAVLSAGTAEDGVLGLLERVDLEWLNTLKLSVVGAVQRRRLRAERELRHQAG